MDKRILHCQFRSQTLKPEIYPKQVTLVPSYLYLHVLVYLAKITNLNCGIRIIGIIDRDIVFIVELHKNSRLTLLNLLCERHMAENELRNNKYSFQGKWLLFFSGEEFQNQVAHLPPMEQEQMLCPAKAVEFAVPI